ncbi:hypothetical protein HK105_207651 [Polyrhizophydium stewartii]|uniref:Copper acquisition factor BIM1-like domain-containing protein n=1 Tax=Polyrhizophydium stewartii TaxID=2732419 RepID=A0ABR4N011_9FUNG
MLTTTALALLLAAATPAAAHFTISTPPNRGHDELVQDQAPCGGFAATGPRTAVDQQTSVVIRMADRTSTCNVRLGLGDNPSSFPVQLASQSFTALGVYTIGVNLAAAGSVANGAPATIQVQCSSEHGTLYECSDISIRVPQQSPQPPSRSPTPSPQPPPPTSAAASRTTQGAATTSGTAPAPSGAATTGAGASTSPALASPSSDSTSPSPSATAAAKNAAAAAVPPMAAAVALGALALLA